MLQHQRAQVRVLSDEWPVDKYGTLLPALVHPADCVQEPRYHKMLERQHAQVRGFSG